MTQMLNWIVQGFFKKEKILEKNRFFEVKEYTDFDMKIKKVIIKDQGLKNQLFTFFPNYDELYSVKPEIAVEVFLPQLENIREQTKQWRGTYNSGIKRIKSALEVLEDFLEEEFKNHLEKIKELLKKGMISYKFLWYIFKKGSLCLAKDKFNKSFVCTRVEDCNYSQGFFNSSFVLNGRLIRSNGKEFISYVKQFKIYPFKGAMEIKTLPFYPLDEKDEKINELMERGKIYSDLAIGSKYLNYKGNIFSENKFFVNEFNAEGRCMIDVGVFIKMNPDYYGNFQENQYSLNIAQQRYGRNVRQYTIKKYETLSKDQLVICDSIVAGFSFRLKKWGEFLLENLEPIKFNDKAFDTLVLDEKKKSLIKSFVVNNNKTISDVIQNKGGGCVILLHGPPGSGKTLTSESIAELLHKPLYSCSIGELGTNVTTLEKNLANILEICKMWDAVLLIDEADIFLEQRTKNDIERNAMVGVFLRLLEYHDGVLFLTTNRVECFDKAFQSRISIAFEYKELGKEARKKVWKNLFEFFEFDYSDVNIDEVGKYLINGRQIRTVIKLASTMSDDFNKEVKKFRIFQKHIDTCVEFVKDFNPAFENKEK